METTARFKIYQHSLSPTPIHESPPTKFNQRHLEAVKILIEYIYTHRTKAKDHLFHWSLDLQRIQ